MSFKVVAASHGRPDKDFPQRTFDVGVRLSLLNGTFYDKLPFEFHQSFVGGQFVYMENRKPNVPTGTNEIRLQTERHVSTLFGEMQFPDVETADETARQVIKEIVEECDLPSVMRQAAFIASTGSSAIHLRALAAPGKPLRLFPTVYDTRFLTPTFDRYEPDRLIAMREQYKVLGRDLVTLGYKIEEADYKEWFFFRREWDTKSEIWYHPWKVSDQRNAEDQKKDFNPQVDEVRSVRHNLGLCPFKWMKPPQGGRDAIDGRCSFESAIEHAIQLDYEDSQIVSGIRYAMSPTTVFTLPPTAPQPEGSAETEDGAMVKSPETTLTIPVGGDVKYLEMTGDSFKEAREKAKELRTSTIESLHGDRIDPKEITAGHQGQQTMIQINSPMIKHIESLKGPYGRVLLDLIRMALEIAEKRPVIVKGKIIPREIGKTTDLTLRWGDIYPLSAAEKLALAQTHETLIRSGVESRATATKDIAATFSIPDVAAERVVIEAEQKAEDARIKALQAQVQDRVQLEP